MTFGGTTKANVLIVDDTLENLQLLSRILNADGYEARPVSSGAMALQAVEADPPDLILLDINMAPMGGYEVCQRLKANPATQHIPIIFVSALDEAIDKVRAFALGAVDYVTKPFQVAEVLARVRTHLQLEQAHAKLEQSYETLRKLEAMRDSLVHMVVHDLRSPLTALLFGLASLREELTGTVSEDVMQDLTTSEAAAKTIVGMANDLLDVSRLEDSHMPVQLATDDLVQVVHKAVDAVRGMQPGRQVVIEADGPTHAVFDAALIRRVVENLVSNGFKHTPRDRPLRIRIEHIDEPRVSVRDEGQGIPAEFREVIFDKYGTAQARDEGAYHSVGLGLAFCKLAVRAHGGRIGVESEVGVGSEFWFTLPNRTEPS